MTEVLSEFENIEYDIAQIILISIAIYLLIVFTSLQEKVVKRDDPFLTGNILAFIITIVVLQKYLTESILTSFLAHKTFFTQKLLITFKQTIVAIEILFLQIPIRHNFSHEHVDL